MIDFWQDGDGTNNDDIPPIRGRLVQHSTFFNDYSFEGLDIERIKAYCKATGKEYEKQAINAKFMNEMEDWYLRLAEQYPALDKIRDEICDIDDEIVLNPDSFFERKAYIRFSRVINIIDKYKAESEDT